MPSVVPPAWKIVSQLLCKPPDAFGTLILKFVGKRAAYT